MPVSPFEPCRFHRLLTDGRDREQRSVSPWVSPRIRPICPFADGGPVRRSVPICATKLLLCRIDHVWTSPREFQVCDVCRRFGLKPHAHSTLREIGCATWR